jgi:hypothetical protein
MSFEVGDTERHRVQFSFKKFWGGRSITVDGVDVDVDVVRTIRLGSIDLIQGWDFTAGTQEQHQVRIEKHRERLVAGFRPQPVYANVDGQLVAHDTA